MNFLSFYLNGRT